jgi:hypothetical protein
MTIIDNEYARSSVVLDCDYRRGSIADRSPNKAAATVAADALWSRTKQGHAISFRGNGLLSYADKASNRLTGTSATIIVFGKFEQHPLGKRFVAKRDAGGTSFDLSTDASTPGTLNIYDGTNTRTITASLAGKSLLVITNTVGGTPACYLDGTFAANASGTITIPDDDAALIVGNLYSGACAFLMPIGRITLLNRALSTAEISQLYQELMSERFPLRAYSFGSRISAPKDPPGVAALLKTDFTTRLPDGRLADLSGNGWHGTVKPGFVAGPGMCGNALMANSASRTYVDFGDVTPINGAQKLTVLWYGKRGTSNTVEAIFSKATSESARIAGLFSPTAATFSLGNGEYFNIANSSVNVPAMYGFAFDGTQLVPNRGQVYVDSDKPATTVSAGCPSSLPNSAGVSLEVGRLGYSTNNQPPDRSDFLAVYPKALTPEQVSYVYKQIAGRYTFALDLNRTPISLANIVGPAEVPGTPFRLQSGGTCKVSEDAAGKRWFESVSAASDLALGSQQAYGTWVFRYKYAGTESYFSFISNSVDRLNTSVRQMYVLLLTGSDLYLLKYSLASQVNLLVSAGAVSSGTVYDFAITRASSGQFCVYYKRTTDANFALLSATSGSNPSTDAAITTSTMFVARIRANAAFSQPRFFAGALTLSQLHEKCP